MDGEYLPFNDHGFRKLREEVGELKAALAAQKDVGASNAKAFGLIVERLEKVEEGLTLALDAKKAGTV